MRLILFFLLICSNLSYAADKKITEYPADTSPTSDDLILTVNSPASGAANRKVTIGNLLKDSNIQFTDITTGNVSTTKHGFAPKLPNNSSVYLDGTGNYTSPPVSSVTDAAITTSDITTNDVSTAKHGFAPKSPNDSTYFLNGVGAWSVPAGGGGGTGNVGIGTFTPYQSMSAYTASGVLGPTSLSHKAGNYGIGSTNPQQALDINGNLKTNGGISTISWTDPIVDYHASGLITTTTGTITTGTNSLTVSSATGWSVGMGIAVTNAGTGGTTELISTVTAISGTTFTLADNALATATTQTVNHDDTVAIQAALTSGKSVYLRRGNYNITSTLNFNQQGIFLLGDGANLTSLSLDTTFGTNIIYRKSTGNAVAITKGYCEIHNLTLVQDLTITPTSGYLVVVGDGTSTKIRRNVLQDIGFLHHWGGIKVQNSVSNSYFQNLSISVYGGVTDTAGALYVSNETSAGDNFWDNINIGCFNAGGYGIFIDAADTSFFSNIKITGLYPAIIISDAVGKTIAQQRFTNVAVENGNASGQSLIRISGNTSGSNRDISFLNTHIGVVSQYGIRMTGSATNYSFAGGTLVDITTGFSIESGVSNVTISDMNFTNLTTGIDIQSGASNVKYFGNNFASNVTNPIVSNGVSTSIGTNTAGNLGIGTTKMNNKLSVLGGVTIGSGLYAASTAPSNGLIVSGNVGVGTIVPQQALDVNGTIKAGAVVKGWALNQSATSATIWAGGYAAIDTGAATVGSGLTEAHWLNNYQQSRIRQNGTLTRVDIYLPSKPASLTALYFEVWRPNTVAGTPTSWDLVSSQNILSLVSGSTTNQVTLATPITVQEGDFTGIGFTASSDPGNFLRATTGGIQTNATYSTTGAYGTTGYNWAAQTTGGSYFTLRSYVNAAPVIVFIGDSLTAGALLNTSFVDGVSATPATNLPATFPYKVGHALGVTYQNMGVGGQWTTHINARFTTDVVNLQPKIVVIEGSVNDINNSVASSTILANWKTMLDTCATNGIIPVVSAVWPTTALSNANMTKLTQLNDDLRRLVSTYRSAIWFDPTHYWGTFRSGGDVGNLWDPQSIYISDGTHGTDLGYTQIANALLDAFSTIASSQTKSNIWQSIDGVNASLGSGITNITGNVGFSGNFGIGTTVPTGLVQVVGIGTTVPELLCRKADGVWGVVHGPTFNGTCN